MQPVHDDPIESRLVGRARDLGGFGLSVKLTVTDPTIPQAELAALANEAHEKICPYSHATRGNVQVDFEVVGA